MKLIPGMEPEILRYIGSRYDAIIIESYGVGGIPFYNKRNFLAELEQLTREGKIVVIATQVMLEGSDAEVYEVGFKAVNQYNVLQAFYGPVHHDILSWEMFVKTAISIFPSESVIMLRYCGQKGRKIKEYKIWMF